MKKTAKRPNHTRLRSIDAAQLATVSGGAQPSPLLQANWHLGSLASDWPDGSGWEDFFGAASKAVVSCTCY